LIKDERGHDDCYDWTGPLATSGRIWVDAETFDVLRIDRRSDAPVDIRVPWKLQRDNGLPSLVVMDRDEETIRFHPVTFSDPEETLVLPASVEALTIFRGGLQSNRRNETFSDYRRFLTAGHVIKN